MTNTKTCFNCGVYLDESIDNIDQEICIDCEDESKITNLLSNKSQFKPIKINKKPNKSEF